MKNFEMNVITKSDFENKFFICPVCLIDDVFLGVGEVLGKDKTFKGHTAECAECQSPYLVLDEMSIPQHNLSELIKKGPIVINSTVEFIKELKEY